MTRQVERLIPKLNDRDLINAFEFVASKFKPAKLTFSDRFGAVEGELLDQLKADGGYVLVGASLSLDSCSWSWNRKQDHESHDRLAQGWNPQAGQPDRSIVNAVTSTLDKALARPLYATDPENPPSTATSISQGAILIALEGAVAKLVDDTANYRKELDRSFAEKEKSLSDRIEEQRQAELDRLDEERRRHSDEAAQKQKLLDQRQLELDERQKKLDDRNNTHVRREIRSALMKLAQERLSNFSVSKATRTQYIAVHIVCVITITALAGASLYLGSSAFSPGDAAATADQNPYTSWLILAKSGLLAAVAIAIGTWYLKWLNRWLQRIADAEFRLQQFRLDIERASWLAETVLEWKSKTDEPFPDLLASRLSNGLFESSGSNPDDPRTPATQLAEALLGAASTTKIKLGDQELTFDRKGLRNLKSGPTQDRSE